MNTLAPLLQHSLLYGSVLSALLSAFIIGSLWYNAEMWLGDYPPDIRAQFGPMSATAKRQRTLLVIPFFATLLIMVVYSTMQLPAAIGGQMTFLTLALHLFVMLMVFNLVDLLIIDWLFMGVIRPQFIILPGTEGMAGYNSYRFAFRGFLIGTVGIAIASVVIAGLVTAVI